MYSIIDDKTKLAILSILTQLWDINKPAREYRASLEYFIIQEILEKGSNDDKLLKEAAKVFDLLQSNDLSSTIQHQTALDLDYLLLATNNRYITISMLEDVLVKCEVTGNEVEKDDLLYNISMYQPNEEIFASSGGEKNGLLQEKDMYQKVYTMLMNSSITKSINN